MNAVDRLARWLHSRDLAAVIEPPQHRADGWWTIHVFTPWADQRNASHDAIGATLEDAIEALVKSNAIEPTNNTGNKKREPRC